MKWLVEAIVWRSDRWDMEKKRSVQVEPYLYHPCGGSYSAYVSGLKTIRGVANRIKSWVWPTNVVEVRVYQCMDDHIPAKSPSYIMKIEGGKHNETN
jgi:hypothetical protein